ncbi:hypothetical protein ACFXA3_00825 [Streptomyces sp. NPDC059456]|uniref:hypothetical protein n=1 Tax=Streptomyces sp. NPDC059456 TaxID=3346838 RepID=UPI00369442F4
MCGTLRMRRSASGPYGSTASSLISAPTSPACPRSTSSPYTGRAQASEQMLTALVGEPARVTRTEEAIADGVPVTLYRPEGEGPHPVLI